MITAPTTSSKLNSPIIPGEVIGGIQPHIAKLADGSFVAVYSQATQTAEGDIKNTIYSQSLTAAGALVGDRIVVTELTSSTGLDSLTDPDIAALSDGGYVVGWELNSLDLNNAFTIDSDVVVISPT